MLKVLRELLCNVFSVNGRAVVSLEKRNPADCFINKQPIKRVYLLERGSNGALKRDSTMTLQLPLLWVNQRIIEFQTKAINCNWKTGSEVVASITGHKFRKYETLKQNRFLAQSTRKYLFSVVIERILLYPNDMTSLFVIWRWPEADNAVIYIMSRDPRGRGMTARYQYSLSAIRSFYSPVTINIWQRETPRMGIT